MIPVILQTIFTIAAVLGLYLIWRNIHAMDRTLAWVVAAGFLVRAICGQILFWVSWLEMIPRGLHLGGGFWFFAKDGVVNMYAAGESVARGRMVLAAQAHPQAAPIYHETLTVFTMMFGRIASIGLLLNLLLYVGVCWVVARFSRDVPHGFRAALFLVAALAFSPAGILWSLQPLKDPMIQAMLVAIPAGAFLWQRAWIDLRSAASIAGAAITIWVLQVSLAASRWYVGVAVFGSVLLFLCITVWMTRQRRAAAVVISSILAGLLTLGVWHAIRSDLPAAVHNVFTRTHAQQARNTGLLQGAVGSAESVREGFVRTEGSTSIRLPPGASRGERWLAGAVAATVPHFLIERIGFPSIGGGRGLFWFADVDTLVFDLVVVLGVAMFVRQRQKVGVSSGLAWLCPLAAVLLAIPLLYVITNFGTLMRLRGMIYVLCATWPLAQVWGASSTKVETRPAD